MTSARPSDTNGGRGATISACSRYRYELTRRWSDSTRSVTWIMLNPSTADAAVDDPTIRRCIAFSKAWLCGSLRVCNLYALRSTDPSALWKCADPVGPENDRYLSNSGGDVIVCAWGANAKADRAKAVYNLLNNAAPMMCLGRTKAGAPKHPLYVAGATQLEVWKPW